MAIHPPPTSYCDGSDSTLGFIRDFVNRKKSISLTHFLILLCDNQFFEIRFSFIDLCTPMAARLTRLLESLRLIRFAGAGKLITPEDFKFPRFKHNCYCHKLLLPRLTKPAKGSIGNAMSAASAAGEMASDLADSALKAEI